MPQKKNKVSAKKKEQIEKRKVKNERKKRVSNLTSQVFTNSRIVTNILLHLPFRDLLFSQRISPFVRETIGCDPILQERLFFKTASTRLEDGSARPVENNEVLLSYLGADFLDGHYAISSDPPRSRLLQFFYNPRCMPIASWCKMRAMQPAGVKMMVQGSCKHSNVHKASLVDSKTTAMRLLWLADDSAMHCSIPSMDMGELQDFQCFQQQMEGCRPQ